MRRGQRIPRLGGKDALSLGIGGDTTLIANDTVYNRPMDSWIATSPTERKVSNAIVIVPNWMLSDAEGEGDVLVVFMLIFSVAQQQERDQCRYGVPALGWTVDSA
ncbi:hypothetical protein ACIQV3_32520 [Streptomyces sp. NPDC099050]|uniref:hypothetical protein n=1 Tax=Streptomyces sp. NPDC099050 TaxID=3366100 RepID=UPI003812436C